MEIYIDAGFELKRKRSIGSFNGKEVRKLWSLERDRVVNLRGGGARGGVYNRNLKEQSEGMGKRERG